MLPCNYLVVIAASLNKIVTALKCDPLSETRQLRIIYLLTGLFSKFGGNQTLGSRNIAQNADYSIVVQRKTVAAG